MNKKAVSYLVLSILSILIIIGDVLCLCGLWHNHPGNVITLAIGIMILIPSLIRYFRVKGEKKDQ